MTTGILSLILDSSTVAKLVLTVLLGFSIVSWAVIAERWRLFKRAERQSRRFLRAFRGQTDLRKLHQDAGNWPDSPSANVFRAVFGKFSEVMAPPEKRANPGGMVQGALTEAIYRELDRTGHAELARFEKRLSILATAGSVCPFLGLFGTVWGIMAAFLNISAQGSTNITTVAPGIAEALITTIAGLAVAIPAVVAYNHFLNRTRALGLELEDLSTDLLNRVQLQNAHENV